LDGDAARIELGGNQLALFPMSPLEEIARRLLDQAGCNGEFVLTPLPGGRNNRVWRLGVNETDFLLKQYYWTENDRRDRMGHEWDFLTYLRGIGCTSAARPIAADLENRSALIEFIEGVTPRLSEIGEPEIHLAAQFFAEMNGGRFSDAGRALSSASEACFSLDEHVATTERRVERLSQIEIDGDESRATSEFATETVLPLWKAVRTEILDCAGQSGGMERSLEPQERCLSPSDFGFHNSLHTPAGMLRFVDFEYSGWDDPAKTISDFANQPDMLLDSRLSDIFRESALALFPDDGALATRLRLLTPLYQIKWACICLNEFLPAGSNRRAFTGLKTDEGPTRLAGHLERARVMAARAAKSLDKSPFKSSVSGNPAPPP
jgi:hypothetical protein